MLHPPEQRLCKLCNCILYWLINHPSFSCHYFGCHRKMNKKCVYSPVGGWKLVLSDTRAKLRRSNQSYVNDVFIRAAIEAHSERWSWFTQTAFVCLGRNSLSRCCQLVSSRSILTAHPYTRSIGMFPWESSRKILRVIKCYSSRSRAHLTVFTERVLFQTNKSCLCKSISPFTIGHYGSPTSSCSTNCCLVCDRARR